MYRICWKSRVNGLSGNGEYMFALEKGNKQIIYLNKTYPETDHWLEMQPPAPLSLSGHRCSYGDLTFVPNNSNEPSPS